MENIEQLRAVIDRVPEHRRDTASDLINSYDNRGWLSPKQWKLVARLTAMATGGPDAPPTDTTLDGPEIIRFFDDAAEREKYPECKLRTGDGRTVILKRAGDRSKYTGAVNVTDDGRYPDNAWFGRVERSGEFKPGGDLTSDVMDTLREFAADPYGVAGIRERMREPGSDDDAGEFNDDIPF